MREVASLGRVGEIFISASGTRVRVVGIGPVVWGGWKGLMAVNLR